MTELISVILPYIAPGALPLILVILGIAYIQSKRKETKKERDTDSQQIHDKILKHDFEITNLKGEVGHQRDIQDDLAKQINILSQSVAKFSVAVEHLTESVKDIRIELKDRHD